MENRCSSGRAQDRNIYHIGTNEELPIRELAGLIARKMGLEIRIVPSERRAGGTPRRCPDITKLQALGYEPKLPLAEGLDESIAWYSDWADRNPEPSESS